MRRFIEISPKNEMICWGERRGLNPRPSVPQTDALPAELRSPQSEYTQFRPQPVFSKVEPPLLAIAGDRAEDVLLAIQSDLLRNPIRGSVVRGVGGIRKAKTSDPARNKGK